MRRLPACTHAAGAQPRPSSACCTQDGKHGTAWGVLTWRGQAQRPEALTAVNGPLKPVWRVVQEERPEWQSVGLRAALEQQQQPAAAAPAADAQPAAAAAEQPAAA